MARRAATGVVIAACAALFATVALATPLDDYVNKADPSYEWTLANTVDYPDYTFYVLRLTSQTWLTPDRIDVTVWTHWLRLAVPKNLARSELACIYLNGGGNPLGGAPSNLESFLADVAVRSGLIVAELNQIPNQPIRFADEDFGRSEDALIAKTWDIYIRTRDAESLVRLPMVKASVRAMDAMQEFIRTLGLPNVPSIDRFVIAGGSKRGWTTWLTGAVDTRVAGIAPIVIEILDMTPNLNFEWQVYGRWPVAFSDYTAMNITRCLNCPIFKELGEIEDPIVYLDRFLARNVPIVSVSAVGDEFFLPDGFQWWYYDYTGEKYLAIQPNAEHSMFNRIAELSNTLQSFMYTVERRVARPQFTWTMSPDGTRITVNSVDRPTTVRAYSAYNEKRGRSFIVNCYLSCVWRATDLVDIGNNTYVAEYPVPTVGYTGFFIELGYEVAPGVPLLTVTTGVSIVPQVLPYPPCPAEQCGLCTTCEPQDLTGVATLLDATA